MQPDITLPSTVIRQYHARIAQSGSSAPTAIIQHNTLTGTPIWTRYDVGIYVCSLSGLFTIENTNVQIGMTTGKINPYLISGGELYIYNNFPSTGSQGDNMVISIIIRMYQ